MPAEEIVDIVIGFVILLGIPFTFCPQVSDDFACLLHFMLFPAVLAQYYAMVKAKSVEGMSVTTLFFATLTQNAMMTNAFMITFWDRYVCCAEEVSCSDDVFHCLTVLVFAVGSVGVRGQHAGLFAADQRLHFPAARVTVFHVCVLSFIFVSLSPCSHVFAGFCCFSSTWVRGLRPSAS